MAGRVILDNPHQTTQPAGEPMGRKPFLRYLFKLAILPFILAVVYGLLFIHQSSALYTKHQLLVNSTGPKLVLVGGSNVLYGIDGSLLEEKTNYSVVNYGLRAQTPLSFYEKEISPHVKSGDLILFIMEYGYYYGASNDMAVTYILQTYPQGIPSLLPEYLGGFPEYGRALVPDQLVHYIKGVPERNDIRISIDAWGGSTDLLDYDGYFVEEVGPDRIRRIDEIDATFAPRMNQFARKMAEKGVTVAIVYPVLWDKLLAEHPSRLKELDAYLRSNLEIPVIGTPELFSFPREMLSNSPYHVNRNGREIRSQRLVDLLISEGFISQPSGSSQ